jgi:hypothetical protein
VPVWLLGILLRIDERLSLSVVYCCERGSKASSVCVVVRLVSPLYGFVLCWLLMLLLCCT